ncbi:Uncharacterised protein [Mycobacterium tuberculosis]|nr:Uncharacterised protein [Mycobacterium tuberculosis]COW89945.1 Uncharacterised protein [Mycobacterium tuberculosis]
MRVGDRNGRDCDAARVGVLDDRHARLFVVEGGPPGCVRIGEVVVGHVFSVQLLGLGQPRPGGGVAVESGLLVRVLAVAQHRHAAPASAEPLRKGGNRMFGR